MLATVCDDGPIGPRGYITDLDRVFCKNILKGHTRPLDYFVPNDLTPLAYLKRRDSGIPSFTNFLGQKPLLARQPV